MAESSKTFVIIGLGLLGGSLGGALKRIFPKSNILGVSRSSSKIRLAEKRKLITSGTTDLKKAVSQANYIFICTPVDTIPKLLLQIDRFAKKGTVVTDVGSTKGELIRWVEKRKLKNIQFVGSHPMAGSHLTGIEYATRDLYKNSFTFITRHPGMNQKAFALTAQLWKKICKHVVVIDAKIHDQVTADISHLPHLIASLLVMQASEASLRFASTGFRDTTRVAAGDPRLWMPIFISNSKELITRLESFGASLRKLISFLQTSNQAAIGRFLTQASKKRSHVKIV